MRGRKKMMAAFECKNHIGRDDRYSTGDLFIWPRGHLNASEYFREDTPDDWIYSRACGSLARSFKAWLTPVFSTLLGKRELGHVRISNDPPLILRLFPFLSFSSLPLTAHVSNFTLYAFKWKNYNQFIFSNGTCFFFNLMENYDFSLSVNGINGMCAIATVLKKRLLLKLYFGTKLLRMQDLLSRMNYIQSSQEFFDPIMIWANIDNVSGNLFFFEAREGEGSPEINIFYHILIFNLSRA